MHRAVETLEQRVLLSASLVKDIAPGVPGSAPSFITDVGGTTFFVTSNDLWRTDGTAAGTTLVKAHAPPTLFDDIGFGSLGELVNGNGTLYFIAVSSNNAGHAQLWKSDGTTQGTVKIADITSSSGFNGSFGAYGLTYFNGKVFFKGVDSLGGELWASDGTPGGTGILKNINTNFSSQNGYSNPRSFTPVGNQLFFVASDGTTGYELWKTDGTTPGTLLVRDIAAGARGAYAGPTNLTSVNGRLFFVAADDGWLNSELWVSDGTFAGTILARHDPEPVLGSGVSTLAELNGTLYFAATGGLWRSDGTDLGTTLVSSLVPSRLTKAGDALYFVNGSNLYSTDGTIAGTQLIKALPGSGTPASLVGVGSRLFFTYNDPLAGRELWQSDGTANTTVIVRDINVGLSASNPRDFAVSGNRLFFAADDGNSGIELWRADGPPFATLTDGVVTITGTASADTVVISRAGANVRVSTNGDVQTFSAVSVHRVELFAGAGNDVVMLSPAIPETFVEAGLGNDLVLADPALRTSLLITGSTGNDTIVGGAGHDEISGANGNDRIFGGTGHDFLLGGGLNDYLNGGAGDDICIGGGGHDRLYGDGGADQLIAGLGNDFLDGVFLAGGTNVRDTLSGGPGVDTGLANLEDIVDGVENLTQS